MPLVRVTKQKDSNESSLESLPSARRGNPRKNADIKQMKLMAEASKYVKDTSAELGFWRKIKSTRLMPEVREQAAMVR